MGYCREGGVRGVELSELTLAALRETKLTHLSFESQVCMNFRGTCLTY